MLAKLKLLDITKKVKSKAKEIFVHEDMGSKESWEKLFEQADEPTTKVVNGDQDVETVEYDYEQKERLEEGLRQAYATWNMLYQQYQTCTDEDYEKIIYQRLVAIGGKRMLFKWEGKGEKLLHKSPPRGNGEEESRGEIGILKMCLAKLGEPPVSEEESMTFVARSLAKCKRS